MTDAVVQVLLLVGSVFVLLAGIGVLRMPDLYMRLSSVTKGASLGLILLLVGVMVEFYTFAVFIKISAVLVFGFATSPVSAHMVSRAAYFQGVELWEGTQIDELKGHYEMRHHDLESPEPGTTMASEILGAQVTGEQRDHFERGPSNGR